MLKVRSNMYKPTQMTVDFDIINPCSNKISGNGRSNYAVSAINLGRA